MPTAILVVGMHRSGTSALARVISLLGADLPRNLEGPGVGNETGHWEPGPAVQLHRQMLADAGSTTNSPIDFPPSWFDGPSASAFVEKLAALIGEEYGSSPFFVMKEPRATLLVPCWIAALKRLGIQPHFAIAFRHPLAVALSLTARQQAVVTDSIWPTSRGVALWQRYMLAAERWTRGWPRSFVSFDALLSDWWAEVTRLGDQLGLAWPREPAQAAADIGAFLKPQHRHQDTADSGAELPPAVASVFAALQQAVADPRAPTEVFDQAARDIAAGEELLAPYVRRLEARVEAGGTAAVARKIAFVSGAPDAPNHTYRVEHHAGAAQRLGHRATTLTASEAGSRLAEIDGADAVTIWHVADDEAAPAIARARATGAKVIVDVDERIFDDAPAPSQIKHLMKAQPLDVATARARLTSIARTIAGADLCTATSQSLLHHLRDFGRPLWRLPSGFEVQAYADAQLAAEEHRRRPDGIRIGLAGGADEFAAAMPALVRILEQYQDSRLIWLGEPPTADQLLALADFAGRIEQRGDAPVAALAREFARLDIAIAPPGARERLTQARDAIAYVHAALGRVPMLAPSSGFFADEITPGVTGLLAQNEDEWTAHICRLIENAEERRTIGENALHDVLWRFGPENRDRQLATMFDYLFSSGRQAAAAFRSHIEDLHRPVFVRPPTPQADIVLETERKATSPVAVAIPLYNYAQFIQQTLDSVKDQTFGPIDLVVVDDCSTDASLDIARRWIEQHHTRFNHAALLRNRKNSSLGPTRNAALTFASARYVMLLDADNILLPPCLERCHATLEISGAAAAFPILQQFGDAEGLIGDRAWQAARLACSNYIDAMAMIRKAAWAACGGYANLPTREDYELWMKFVERGFWAAQVPEVLARYRVHDASLVNTFGTRQMIEARLWNRLAASHPWIALPTWSQTEDC